LYREALGSQRRVLGPEHRNTLLSMTDMAMDISHQGRYVEAEKLQREAMEIDRRVLGPEHPITALSKYDIGCILARKGNRDEAFVFLREAVDHGLTPGFDLGLETDPDLKSLHGDTRFAALVAHAKQRAAAAQKPASVETEPASGKVGEVLHRKL
jgi:Tetratricopeptide repeat